MLQFYCNIFVVTEKIITDSLACSSLLVFGLPRYAILRLYTDLGSFSLLASKLYVGCHNVLETQEC